MLHIARLVGNLLFFIISCETTVRFFQKFAAALSGEIFCLSQYTEWRGRLCFYVSFLVKTRVLCQYSANKQNFSNVSFLVKTRVLCQYCFSFFKIIDKTLL